MPRANPHDKPVHIDFVSVYGGGCISTTVKTPIKPGQYWIIVIVHKRNALAVGELNFLRHNPFSLAKLSNAASSARIQNLISGHCWTKCVPWQLGQCRVFGVCLTCCTSACAGVPPPMVFNLAITIMPSPSYPRLRISAMACRVSVVIALSPVLHCLSTCSQYTPDLPNVNSQFCCNNSSRLTYICFSGTLFLYMPCKE